MVWMKELESEEEFMGQEDMDKEDALDADWLLYNKKIRPSIIL